ncbi:MAG: hypothetical protein IJH20_06720 [Bacilli bacterium]|nr:hypothetical protein [Bacilli bacterium]
MNVKELNKEQLQQLKIRYLDELLQEEEGRNISYGEMANIDEIVSDKIIYDLYESTTFVDEDFF